MFRIAAVVIALCAAPASWAVPVQADLTGTSGLVTQALGGGAGAFPDPVALFPDTGFEGTVSAASGLFDSGATISTDADGDALIFDFSAPILGLQIFGGIGDEFGTPVSGTLTFSVLGTDLDYALGNAFGPIGLRSDTGFTNAILSLTDFDDDASAIAFIEAASISVAPVPLPAGALLLLTGLGAFCVARRRSDRAAA